MKIIEFDYTKELGATTTNRKLLFLSGNKESVEGIDFSHLTEIEIESAKKIQTEYENKMGPYLKAFRKFKVSNMKILHEEKT